MRHPCQYCNRTLGNKRTLIKHQKTAKYCLKIQKQKLLEHEKSQKQKLKEQEQIQEREKKDMKIQTKLEMYKSKLQLAEYKIEELKHLVSKQAKEIKEYKAYCLDRKNRSNIQVNNNTTYNSLQMLIEADFENSCQHLNRRHIMDGGKGIARYAMEHPLKSKIICSDSSRNVLKFKDENGDIITDPGGKKISKRIIDSIKPKVKEICDIHQYDPDTYDFEYLSKLGNNGSNIYNSDMKFVSSMVKEMSLLAAK